MKYEAFKEKKDKMLKREFVVASLIELQLLQNLFHRKHLVSISSKASNSASTITIFEKL